jgi:hypothetical protein
MNHLARLPSRISLLVFHHPRDVESFVNALAERANP